MSRILLVNADPTTQAQVHQALAADNHQIDCMYSVDEALAAIVDAPPDLFILGMAQLDDLAYCIALCRQIRETPTVSGAAILFLTEAHSASEIAAVLDAGADDHLRQPFAERELAARVRALLRRTAIKQRRAVVTLEPQLLAVTIAGQRIGLSPVEFELITALSKNRNRYLSSTDLLHNVWHYPPGSGDTALVRNHIRNLRMKIEEDLDHPRLIVSHQGRGYMLCADIAEPVS